MQKKSIGEGIVAATITEQGLSILIDYADVSGIPRQGNGRYEAVRQQTRSLVNVMGKGRGIWGMKKSEARYIGSDLVSGSEVTRYRGALKSMRFKPLPTPLFLPRTLPVRISP